MRGDLLERDGALEQPAVIHREGVGDALRLVALGHVKHAGVAGRAPMLRSAGAGGWAVVVVLDLLALVPRGPAGPVAQVIDERENMAPAPPG